MTKTREEALRRLREPAPPHPLWGMLARKVLAHHPRHLPSTWLLAAAAWLDRPDRYTLLVHALDWSAGRLVERGL